jgi:hypothetical protein
MKTEGVCMKTEGVCVCERDRGARCVCARA